MKPHSHPSYQSGFTLVELMVTIAILAILTALAAPAMGDFISGQRVRTLASDFNMVLIKTRSEAIKRNRSVTLNANSQGWNSGWTIADPANPDGAALATHTVSSTGAAVVTASLTQLVYTGSGRITAATAPTFVFSSSSTREVRCVSVDPSGRPYTIKAATC